MGVTWVGHEGVRVGGSLTKKFQKCPHPWFLIRFWPNLVRWYSDVSSRPLLFLFFEFRPRKKDIANFLFRMEKNGHFWPFFTFKRPPRAWNLEIQKTKIIAFCGLWNSISVQNFTWFGWKPRGEGIFSWMKNPFAHPLRQKLYFFLNRPIGLKTCPYR